MDISSEQLAYWYLRLNGFLTIPNFVVHPDCGRNQETDVDVLGIRLPYRAENLHRPMKDEPRFTRVHEKSFIAIAEVKSGRCALNGPWTSPERQNMLRVFRAVGAFPKIEADLAAQSLYETGHYQSQLYYVSLMCLGREVNPDVAARYPLVPQVLWPDVLAFIYRRFSEYKNQKASHPQWDAHGTALWEVFERSRDERQFEENIRVL
ncbi:MAG: hypothetical protein BGP20_01220 [Thiobacillus sp. 63-78]|nr:MAG: hypothetical protein BGP20_01220 [Thiobacillus sp. 63-78]